jgi:type IV secretion system protein VirB4
MTEAARPSFAKEACAGSRLPYSHHVDDTTLALRDGSLCQVIRLDGLLFETAETGMLNHRHMLREAMLRAVGSPRLALYHHILRRLVQPVLGGTFPDAFSARLDAAWQAKLATRELYTNDLFITILRRPPALKGLRRRVTDYVAERRALHAASDQVLAALAPYGARMLGVYDTPHGPCSEVLEFLSALYNGPLGPVRLPYGDVGDYIPQRRVSFGADTLELGSGADRQWAAMVSVKDYPGMSTPGMLDDLLRLPCAMTISQSYAFVERGQSLSRINLALRRMRAADDEALSLRADLALAKDDVAAGRALFGEHHMTLCLRGDSQAQVDAHVAEVQAALGDLGLVAVREDVGLEPAFWAQFPGNFAYIGRRALISTANFAAFASGHNFPLGRAEGKQGWGQPVALFETTAAGPYYFNFHASGDAGELGNFTVIGPSGSGKTVIVNFLLAQARRFAPRIVFFDKDRGAESFIRALGGHYAALRPDVPCGLNPLAMADTPANRAFLCDWLACLAGGLRDGAEGQALAEAVAANFAAPVGLRRLRHFVSLLRGGERPASGDLFDRLRPWWGEGDRAWLFDHEAQMAGDGLDLDQPTLGFDMTMVLDAPALRTPVMMYLFHRVDQRLDGTPTIIVVDEGWKALDDPLFVQRIRDWQKTIRKRGGLLGFVTQNAEDALSSQIAGAIVEQTATQIFTPNAKARAQDYQGGFGLTRHEFDLLRALPENSRCFLVKQGGESVVLRLDLGGERALLDVLAGRHGPMLREVA